MMMLSTPPLLLLLLWQRLLAVTVLVTCVRIMRNVRSMRRMKLMMSAGRCALLPGHNVNNGVFNERHEDKEKTDNHPHIDGLDVGDAGQRLPRPTAHRRHC